MERPAPAWGGPLADPSRLTSGPGWAAADPIRLPFHRDPAPLSADDPARTCGQSWCSRQRPLPVNQVAYDSPRAPESAYQSREQAANAGRRNSEPEVSEDHVAAREVSDVDVVDRGSDRVTREEQAQGDGSKARHQQPANSLLSSVAQIVLQLTSPTLSHGGRTVRLPAKRNRRGKSGLAPVAAARADRASGGIVGGVGAGGTINGPYSIRRLKTNIEITRSLAAISQPC